MDVIKDMFSCLPVCFHLSKTQAGELFISISIVLPLFVVYVKSGLKTDDLQYESHMFTDEF